MKIADLQTDPLTGRCTQIQGFALTAASKAGLAPPGTGELQRSWLWYAFCYNHGVDSLCNSASVPLI
jgi:hypothetical protein